ncbi:MAG: 50S ribosomal protein L4 [Oligoflexales bacterium]
MQIDVRDIKGKSVKKLTLPESIFNVPLNDYVLYSVAKAFQANQRQGTHAVKTRSFVSGGGKKPFKQKGTGGARQGSSRSPLMPGGAVTHGPQPRDYSEKTNTKTKRLAMKVALSDKVKHGKLVVVNDFAISSYSTKHMIAALKALGVTSCLIADERNDDFLYKSGRNLKTADVVASTGINVEGLLRYESLVISEAGLDSLCKRLEK